MTFRFRLLFILLLGLSLNAAALGSSCNHLINSIYSDRYSVKSTQLRKFDSDQKLRLEISRVNNEKKSYFFGQAKIRGGALLGVGGDVNLTLAVMAKHTELFIYDIDPRVIAFHQIIQSGIRKTNTPADFLKFIERWQKGELAEKERQILVAELGAEKFSLFSKLVLNSDLVSHFKEVQQARDESGNAYTYLGSAENFSFLKSLFEGDKAHFYVGSHFEPAMLELIAGDIQYSGKKVSSIYLSNSLEPRWIMDNRDPSAGMMMMMSMLGSIDRGSAAAELAHINREMAKLKSSSLPAEEAAKLQNEVNEQISLLAMRAQMLAMGRKNWNHLSNGLGQVPLRADAQVLVTTLETFQITQFTNKQFRVFGEEHAEIEGNNSVHWTYASANAPAFVKKMPDAPMTFADWIISELRKIVEE